MTDCPAPPNDMEEPNWTKAGLTAAEVATAAKYWATIIAELQALLKERPFPKPEPRP